MTLGSLINFCDVLMAGGTSRKDHSEVGSGFIHFNFTPWGKAGDKATPSLVGDAVDGVLLRQKRIFLGGSSGLVGPRAVGYGSITGAGQVVRRDVGPGRLVVHTSAAVDEPLDSPRDERIDKVVGKNVTYIANLHALRAWYAGVRVARARKANAADLVIVYEEAIRNLDLCLAERVTRLESYLAERGRKLARAEATGDPGVPGRDRRRRGRRARQMGAVAVRGRRRKGARLAGGDRRRRAARVAAQGYRAAKTGADVAVFIDDRRETMLGYVRSMSCRAFTVCLAVIACSSQNEAGLGSSSKPTALPFEARTGAVTLWTGSEMYAWGGVGPCGLSATCGDGDATIPWRTAGR